MSPASLYEGQWGGRCNTSLGHDLLSCLEGRKYVHTPSNRARARNQITRRARDGTRIRGAGQVMFFFFFAK